MHYEARVHANVRYIADYEKRSIKKGPARELFLRPDKYARVIPNWCAGKAECWAMMVDKWMSEKWARQHVLCLEHRLMMPGAAHHQGSRSLPEVQKVLSARREWQPCNEFTAYVMAHMGIWRLRRGLQQPEHPHPRDSVHGDRKGAPRGHMGSGYRTPFWRSHHEGGRREEARPVLAR